MEPATAVGASFRFWCCCRLIKVFSISIIYFSNLSLFMIYCTHLDMRARRSSELNLLKVDPMAEEGPLAEDDDSNGGCEDMCSSCEPEGIEE